MGRITKPFGLGGEVLVALSSDRTSRLDSGSVLETDRGAVTVVFASPHQDRWIVQLEGISDRDAAERWRGTVLRAEALDDEGGDGLWVHELIGCCVSLVDGTEVGTITEVESNPAADLLVLDSGALVPVVFVTAHAPGQVTIDPPEGLLDP